MFMEKVASNMAMLIQETDSCGDDDTSLKNANDEPHRKQVQKIWITIGERWKETSAEREYLL